MLRWPVRDSICIDCRTALPAGTPCPGGKHRVTKLRTSDGRDALLTEVWGPKSLRRRVGEAARVGAVGGGGISVFDGCSGCDALNLADGHVVLIAGVIMVAVALLWFAIKLLADWLHIRKRRPRPNGAKRGVPLGPATGRYGKVIGEDLAKAPLAATPCVAYALELRDHRMVMLRDAMTLGFEIELDTHERVRVPAGPCVIDLAKAPQLGGGGTYLQTFDPLRNEMDDLEPFPFQQAVERAIKPGDRVEILGRLVPTPDGPGEVGYRDVPRTVLVPDGVPRLRLQG